MRVNGWVALARACSKPERTPLQKMVDLGLQVLTNNSVPPGRVFVMNTDALNEILRAPLHFGPDEPA